MVQIPFFNATSFSQDISLDGTTYRMKIVWNTRGEFWTLSLFTLQDVPILLGIKLVLDSDLLVPYKTVQGIPPGDMIVFDPTNNRSRISFEDFLSTRGLELLYATEVEVAAIS